MYLGPQPRATDHGPRTRTMNHEPRTSDHDLGPRPSKYDHDHDHDRRTTNHDSHIIPNHQRFLIICFRRTDFSLGLPNKYHTFAYPSPPQFFRVPIFLVPLATRSSPFCPLPGILHSLFQRSSRSYIAITVTRPRSPAPTPTPYLDTSPIPPYPHIPPKTLPFNSNVLCLPCSPRPLLSTLRQESLLEQLECIAADVAASEEGKRWAWRVDGWEVT
jgi:hypothetical protein